MSLEPQIELLSRKRRNILFYLLLAVFLVSLPAMIFYTTGYRISFENEETSIVTTGGIYITTDNLEVDVYLDQEQVERPRLFRSAYYIQNIEVGKHRIVVQRPDLYTWVKDLPVDPYIVIEVAAFNMPLTPHIRPVTEHLTVDGAAVYLGVASPKEIFSKSTSTTPIYATSSVATSTYEYNEEFVFVESLFGSTSTSTQSVFSRMEDMFDRFKFATTSSLDEEEVDSELKVTQGNMSLILREHDIYAVWEDDFSKIPFYFCVATPASSSVGSRYGEHVVEAIELASNSTSTRILIEDNRVCRSEIKLDSLRQDLYFYDFFPGNADLVLLQLEDGLYVTEIDDRAWQNSQLLYPGDDFKVVIENDIIYIHEGENYFEVITEIEPL